MIVESVHALNKCFDATGFLHETTFFEAGRERNCLRFLVDFSREQGRILGYSLRKDGRTDTPTYRDATAHLEPELNAHWRGFTRRHCNANEPIVLVTTMKHKTEETRMRMEPRRHLELEISDLGLFSELLPQVCTFLAHCAHEIGLAKM